MVSFRLDPRLCARVDASDVVQEALTEAIQKLPQYVDERPVPFYPWLRQIAWRQIMRLHEEHLYSQKRSVFKEQNRVAPVSDLSCIELARQLAAKNVGPSTIMRKNERIAHVRQAMETLQPNHREVLMLRYVELLSISEIAAVLSISEAAVKMRRVRALEQLRILLGDDELSAES
jgi:RNA polymerase sigma-70 factor (ECF subfamily)